MFKVNASYKAIQWFLIAYWGMRANDIDWLSPDYNKAYKELTDNFFRRQEYTIGNTTTVVDYSLADY